RPFLSRLDQVDLGELEGRFVELEGLARERFGPGAEPELARSADLRYQGQSFELTVAADELDALAGRFHDAHARRYGWSMEDEAVELVNVRLTALRPGGKPELREPAADGPSQRRTSPSGAPGTAGTQASRRRASFDGEWRAVDVVARADLGAGSKVEGPAIVEFAEAT